ncbi:MAG: CPBP family intramembrane glutamic endopeptidase [Chloroflexota bacterium]
MITEGLPIETENLKQHTIGQSVLLHLLPGILTGAGYFALRPFLNQWGFPSMMALMCAVVLILLPVELGYLLYEGKKKNGYFSLRGVVLYRKPIPLQQYFLWIPAIFVLMGIIFIPMKPVDAFFQQKLFSWVPVFESGLQVGYSQSALIWTYIMVAIFGVVIAPTVEEFYFRGYLLPRMEYAGKWAPLLHTFLFGIYHVWTPWMFLTRTLGMLPITYAVRRRNLNLGIISHILVNSLDVITAISFIIGMSSIA